MIWGWMGPQASEPEKTPELSPLRAQMIFESLRACHIHPLVSAEMCYSGGLTVQ